MIQNYDRNVSERELGQYQVWYGYAIKRFPNLIEAKEFAGQNDGVVIDSVTGHVV